MREMKINIKSCIISIKRIHESRNFWSQQKTTTIGSFRNTTPCANQRLRLRSNPPHRPLKLLIQSGNPLPMSGTTSYLMPDFLRLVGCEMINSPLCFAVAFPSVGFSQISYLRLITSRSQPSFSAALRLTDAHTLGKYLAASRKL